MVDALIIPAVEVNGTLTVRPFESGQSVPVIKALSQLTKVTEAIEAIKTTSNIDLIAHWTDYGYATFNQLDAMASIVEARNRCSLVMRTIKWIEQVECLVSDVYNTLRDTLSMTKNEQKGYVETLNLSTSRVPGDVIQGHQLFDFRENLWLHTASILASMMVLRDEYPDVRIINPSYYDFALPDQKRRVAEGLGASDPRYKRVIAIFNIGGHWVAFLIQRTDEICYMFDPLQVDNNYRIIEKRFGVRGVIEDILQVKDALTCEKVDWSTQKDGSPCGVWCIAILELLLIDTRWDDCLYKIIRYLRMRFLHEAIAYVGKTTDAQL